MDLMGAPAPTLRAILSDRLCRAAPFEFVATLAAELGPLEGLGGGVVENFAVLVPEGFLVSWGLRAFSLEVTGVGGGDVTIELRIESGM